MSESSEHDVTRLIDRWRAGEEGARATLMTLVYNRVRAIAGHSLRQTPGATLSATDLAHEALIRMLGSNAPWENRKHFFNVVAQATRQVLVDAARRRTAGKRGGNVEHVEIADALNVSAGQGDGSLLLLDSALNELGQSHPRQVQMIELTYFGGLDRREVAASLEVSEGTVDRDLRLAKAWLRNVLER
ncbi:MAG: ECF-type sigma factor [Dokdonella sp.]|jgi:RNA polymerase sigma-70 factor, ECF subfamily|uniref:ECF-type sigma factor n=1 Tax=Dokdonella sp. TaxID=2291710 RepID=UPI001B5CF139|nr:ECF-type sigma factor [Dokdonella sp.]MCC6441346.1 sigma-70 family RNA polymerase sigma factor [Rhodanobacteraceae bacterium]MBK8123525.1 sigma-70 family RNA polymerase sigma factor [Dokdonella sp.]MBP6326468.1 sigma-70 family RNA polymerase sigma factor [Dokdonella sp.]MBP6330040.1 sigma-70 family RNA polymerase sigma factor [Dokdonella sp.]HNV08357.1 ECF-type sigma factor [Dokdonella sp.]